MITYLSTILQAVPMTGTALDSVPPAVDSTAVIMPSTLSEAQVETIRQIIDNTLEQQTNAPFLSPELIIAIAAVLVAGVAILFCKAQRDVITKLQAKINENAQKIETIEQSISTLSKDVQKIGSVQKTNATVQPKTGKDSKPQIEQGKTDKKQNTPQQRQQVTNGNPATKAQTPTRPVKKMYADFYMEDDAALVEHRDLSNNPTDGKFVILLEEGASKARYTVNTTQMQAIIEDILNFQKFVSTKEIPATYSSIKVESEGELTKTGGSWKIVKKMNVKFI